MLKLTTFSSEEVLGGRDAILRPEHIGQKKREAPMSSERANRWLKQFREETTQELWDLTEHPTFDWQGFVANLPNALEVVGPGVRGFGFLTMEEVKDRSKKGEDRVRNDFVVLRTDDVAVRLHPHKGKTHDAKPIFGNVADWLKSNRDTPAATPSFHAGEEGAKITVAALQTVGAMERIPMPAASFELWALATLEFGEKREVHGWKWWRWLANMSAEQQAQVLGESDAVGFPCKNVVR